MSQLEDIALNEAEFIIGANVLSKHLEEGWIYLLVGKMQADARDPVLIVESKKYLVPIGKKRVKYHVGKAESDTELSFDEDTLDKSLYYSHKIDKKVKQVDIPDELIPPITMPTPPKMPAVAPKPKPKKFDPSKTQVLKVPERTPTKMIMTNYRSYFKSYLEKDGTDGKCYIAFVDREGVSGLDNLLSQKVTHSIEFAFNKKDPRIVYMECENMADISVKYKAARNQLRNAGHDIGNLLTAVFQIESGVVMQLPSSLTKNGTNGADKK